MLKTKPPLTFNLRARASSSRNDPLNLPNIPFRIYYSSKILLERLENVLVSQKVVGPSVLQIARGREIVLHSKTALSACSPLSADGALASYSWSLVSANESYAGAPEVSVEAGRDPRVLVLPPYTLGFAGSTYEFHLHTSFGDMSSSANATGSFSTFG